MQADTTLYSRSLLIDSEQLRVSLHSLTDRHRTRRSWIPLALSAIHTAMSGDSKVILVMGDWEICGEDHRCLVQDIWMLVRTRPRLNHE